MRYSLASCAVVIYLLTGSAVAQPPAGEKPTVTYGAHPSAIWTLRFSPDGSRVLSACSKDVRTWDAATGKEIGVLPGAGGQISAFSADGKRFAIGGRDDVTIHDSESGKELLRIAPNDEWKRESAFPPRVTMVAFSPDGRWLATGGSNGKVGGPHGYPGGVVKIWEAATGKLLRALGPLSHWPVSLAFSSDGQQLVAGTNGAGGELPEPGEVWVWSVEKGNVLKTFKTKEEVNAGDPTTSAGGVAISSDNKLVAVAIGDGRVRVLDLSADRELPARKHDAWVWRVAFSPDGSRLATAGGDRLVRVWNTTTGEQLHALAFNSAQINAVTFSPDGRRIAAASGTSQTSGDVKIWDCP